MEPCAECERAENFTNCPSSLLPGQYKVREAKRLAVELGGLWLASHPRSGTGSRRIVFHAFIGDPTWGNR